MREVTRTILESGDKNIAATEVGSLPISCDSNYFNSYSHFAIHHEMLHVSFLRSFLFSFTTAYNFVLG